jgi:DNA-binding Lrp family transcriptional regulator
LSGLLENKKDDPAVRANILRDFEEVIEAHSLTGFYDILARVTLRDMDDYRE